MTALPGSLPKIPSDHVQAVINQLPALPSALRYYDDFLDTFHSIRDLTTQDEWKVEHDGRTTSMAFDAFGTSHRELMKHVFADLLVRTDPSSVLYYFSALRRVAERFGKEILDCLVVLAPHEVRETWVTQIMPVVSVSEANSLRTALRSLCRLNVGHWSPALTAYVSQLPSPKTDIYKTVRTGDCFVPVDQQALVIDYFDELAAIVAASPERVDTEVLREACVLIVNNQHAFRPGQIARIKTADVRVFNTGAVHYRAPLAKQRDQSKRRWVSRRVKREWCPIVTEYKDRRSLMDDPIECVPAESFFRLTPAEVSRRIRALLERITGEAWTATDLRHSAAQRLADAGTSHIALSEFMGHSDAKTATVYFDTSPTQAQRINQALGLSPIYATVAEVVRTKTIDKAALLRLPPDKQIGGIPHGIPIAGIGGCTEGQSLCIKNPVLSCYTCRNFMPVNDKAIHREVTDGLRPVVLEFAKASRDNEESPAYTQLRRTIEAAEQVIVDIEAQRDDENE
ncbi:tyrosine-type recombinase/integrase [Pelagibius sp. CAU 1746]|uniref:tyrosine-type recombinase/integrase n=1 Tax=Pelagibius sp. CAU 1746 TaxID=3140370 RepID=UPI00325B3872